MSSGSGTGGFGRGNRTEVGGFGHQHRARVPSGHFARVATSLPFARATVTGRAPTVPRGRRRSHPPIGGRGPRRTPRGRAPAGSRRAIGAGGGAPRAGAAGTSRRAFRSSATSTGTSRTIATAGRRCRLRDPEQLGARPVLDVRGVDDGQPAAPQAHLEQPMQEVEGVVGRALGGRIVGDQRAERVRREHLGRREVPVGERALAAGGDADEQDERIGREGDCREMQTDRRACRRSVGLP